MTDGPVIEIRRADEGFAVVVVPPRPDQPDRFFTDVRVARGAAGGLRMVTGWRKVDLVGDAA